jgi:hypothetical protein
MKSLRSVLLVIGIAGVLAAAYALIVRQDWTSGIAGVVCGASLIVGAWQLKDKQAEDLER